MTLCLGLDIGSSSIKGAVLDQASGEVQECVVRQYPTPVPGLPAGWIEIEPVLVVEQVERVLEQLLTVAPDARHLFCCGQMGGVILVDSAGEPLTNYLSWRDQRTLQESHGGRTWLDEVRRRWPQPVVEGLGNELQAGSTTALLFWLQQNGRLPAGAMPATISDFVLGRLCCVAPRLHVTHAIGMLDLGVADWHCEAFELLGLGEVRLPALSNEVEPIGAFERGGKKLEVFGSYGDQQCALFGAGLERGELSINISTGSQVSERVGSFQPGPYQTRMYFEGDWLNTITHLPAGRSLNVLFDLLTELAVLEGVTLQNAWPNIVRLAGERTTNDLEVDLSFFESPLGSSGSIAHITTQNLTVGDLFHAAFRSMAANYKVCAERLNLQRDWKTVVFSGGLTKSAPVLKRLLQERFTAPCREASGEETLNGLLRLAQTVEAV
jgi:sugar (pentulose or hexulose) kinase